MQQPQSYCTADYLKLFDNHLRLSHFAIVEFQTDGDEHNVTILPIDLIHGAINLSEESGYGSIQIMNK